MDIILMSSLPLGLDGVKILLHLFNFAILMAGLTYLLYKPVLKFINNRQNTIKKQLEDNEKNKQEADRALTEYQTKLKSADDEITSLKAEALKQTAAQKEEILSMADKKAQEIVKKAEIETVNERKIAIDKVKNDVVEIAVNIAGGILEREVSEEENAKIIDSCIKEWRDDD